MARVVRKVSNKSVSKQKKQKDLLHNKIFWSILSAVLVVGIVIGVVVGVTVNKKKAEEDTGVNTVDYFATCTDVTFKKGSYAGVKNYTNPNYENPQNRNDLQIENVFVFAYDLPSFYPDKSSDNYNSLHADALKVLIDLQKAVDAAKALGEDVELFIVDTSSGENFYLLTESLFGGDDDSSTQFKFFYMRHFELFEDKVKIEDQKCNLNSTSLNQMVTTVIPKAQIFISSGLDEELIVDKDE